MQAIVLAGGLGTRLRSAIGEYPKPMADINGQPFLSCILRWLRDCGVTDVVLAVSYKWEVIQSYYGHQFEGMNIKYSVEESPMGTGGAVKQAMSLTKCESPVFVLNGDTYFPCDLRKLVEANNISDSIVTIGVKEVEDASRYGTIQIGEDRRILSFREKSVTGKAWINAGIYLCREELIEYLPKGAFSLESYFQEHCDSMAFNAAALDAEIFIDIGIPSDYERAKKIIN